MANKAPHRIAFYADIHYKSDASLEYWTAPHNLDVEAILFGGDNHYSPERLVGLLQGIRKTQNVATKLVVIPGNGDYIDQELNESRAQYQEAVRSVENAVFLDNAVLELPSGVKIIGSTLWSHLNPEEVRQNSENLATHGAKGVDNIRLGNRYLTFDDTNALHAQAVSFIDRELRALSPAERRDTIVCTHFWPTFRWIDPKNENHPKWRATVSSNLDDLIEEVGPRFWLCGHLHETHHVVIGDTQVSANPRVGNGRGTKNPDFDESFVLEWSSSRIEKANCI